MNTNDIDIGKLASILLGDAFKMTVKDSVQWKRYDMNMFI